MGQPDFRRVSFAIELRCFDARNGIAPLSTTIARVSQADPPLTTAAQAKENHRSEEQPMQPLTKSKSRTRERERETTEGCPAVAITGIGGMLSPPPPPWSIGGIPAMSNLFRNVPSLPH